MKLILIAIFLFFVSCVSPEQQMIRAEVLREPAQRIADRHNDWMPANLPIQDQQAYLLEVQLFLSLINE